MKYILTILFVLSVLSCSEADVQVVVEDRQKNDIKILCSLLKSGMTTSEANKVMDDVSPTEITQTSGANIGSGYYIYWNSPSDLRIIIEEPLRAVIPHGETCKANYNSSLQIEEIEFVFVSEQEYQEIVSEMSE